MPEVKENKHKRANGEGCIYQRKDKRWSDGERGASMDGKVTITELAQFASWLEWGQPKGEPGPYLKYFHESADITSCYYTYNPFDMEKRVREAFQGIPESGALLVRVSEKKGFMARVLPRKARLHKGLYNKSELWPVLGRKKYTIAGDEEPKQVEGEPARRGLITGVAMLTAVIYQRAAESYPGAVFYMTDRWPAAVRIR